MTHICFADLFDVFLLQECLLSFPPVARPPDLKSFAALHSASKTTTRHFIKPWRCFRMAGETSNWYCIYKMKCLTFLINALQGLCKRTSIKLYFLLVDNMGNQHGALHALLGFNSHLSTSHIDGGYWELESDNLCWALVVYPWFTASLKTIYHNMLGNLHAINTSLFPSTKMRLGVAAGVACATLWCCPPFLFAASVTKSKTTSCIFSVCRILGNFVFKNATQFNPAYTEQALKGIPN